MIESGLDHREAVDPPVAQHRPLVVLVCLKRPVSGERGIDALHQADEPVNLVDRRTERDIGSSILVLAFGIVSSLEFSPYMPGIAEDRQ